MLVTRKRTVRAASGVAYLAVAAALSVCHVWRPPTRFLW